MKTILLLLVLLFPVLANAGDLVFSTGLGRISVFTREDKPHIYDFEMFKDSCNAMVQNNRVINVVCPESGLEMMWYRSGSKVVVATKGISTKKYDKGSHAYKLYVAITEHAYENNTVVEIQ